MKTLSQTLAIVIVSIFTVTAHAQNNERLNNQVKTTIENEDGMIRLTWETQIELNTKFFIIEKSADGTNYETIGTRRASSNSMFPSTYEYTEEFDSKFTFYRVTLVSMNGNSISSEIVSAVPKRVNLNTDIALK